MLMRCICGFVPVDEGIIRVAEKQIGREVDFPPDTGLILETPGFIDAYTGLHNLRILQELTGRRDDKKIQSVLKAVGLDPDEKKPVRKYSLGMRQRLGIAQAIMDAPTLLVLDEPMNGLDREGVLKIRRLLLEIRDGGTTILLASHQDEDIHSLCDTIYRLEAGKIVGVERVNQRMEGKEA